MPCEIERISLST